ncbi:MAG TPA: glycoside hydrolase family 3 N-terminal domain-containing protein [Solirubrobacteraceae bacterium]
MISALLRLAAAAALATGHGAARPAVAPSRASSSEAARTAAAPPVSRLSRSQLAGQRIIYAYSGLKPPPSLVAAIRAGEAGGVILFAPNIGTRAQIRSTVAGLQRVSLASPLHTRLLILTDQEGGEVRRLPGAPALSEKQIGASTNPLGQARAAGSGAGANLAGVGINVNLTPVLDVFRTSGNFIDEFQRSYSRRATTVSALGGAFISAQQHLGVAATAKHFPGLGAATRSQNTDLRPVTLTQSLAMLRATDEAPYRTAIADGVKLVMTSWATYPALDRRRPAGLSPTVIGGELRGRLHFRGVTITDGIDAGAVTRLGNLGQRGVLAAAAGADLILCAAPVPSENTPAQGITVRGALASALSQHQLSLSAARQAATRILALRARP